MNARKLVPVATFLVWIFNCITYEAIRINGWYNRFSHYGEDDFHEIAISKWGEQSLIVYAILFMCFLAVVFSKRNPKVRYAWLVFSLLILVASCVKIPGAMLGRWGSTADKFLLFYVFFIPIPALLTIVLGIHSARSRSQPHPRSTVHPESRSPL